MNKRLTLSILILMITTVFAYGQQIAFEKNINHEAKGLLQSLNKGGDSLILESKNKLIYQVDIFNESFSESIDVHSNKTKIDLKTLPIGNFVIQAQTDQKLIIMYLEKTEDENITKKQISSYYWVVSESNSNFGSSKTMKLEYKEDVAKLISKNKLELKSDIGKYNKLLVYAIYNKTKFMSKQFRNPKYYKSAEKSKFFNTEPFYTSDNKKENNSAP